MIQKGELSNILQKYFKDETTTKSIIKKDKDSENNSNEYLNNFNSYLYKKYNYEALNQSSFIIYKKHKFEQSYNLSSVNSIKTIEEVLPNERNINSSLQTPLQSKLLINPNSVKFLADPTTKNITLKNSFQTITKLSPILNSKAAIKTEENNKSVSKYLTTDKCHF